MIYKARVISRTSRVLSKKITANNIEDAKESLLKSGFKTIEITPDRLATFLARFKKKQLSRKDHISFFEDFISFIKIGLSTEEILNQIEETNLSKNVQTVSREMVDMIHKGLYLSQAMETTRMFSDLAVKTVRLGESSPSIEPVMEDLVGHYRKEDTFYSGIKKVTFYPSMVMLMIISVFFFFCFGLIPKIQSSLGFKYPLAIRILIKVAESAKDYWYIILFFLIVGISIIRQTRNKKLGEGIHRFIYKIPVVGRVFKEFIFVNIFTNLFILQKSGMPLKNSINNVAEATPYRYISKKLEAMGVSLEKGFSFSEAIAQDSFFPKMVALIIKKGQTVGRLQESFQKISDYYSERLQRDIERILEMTPGAMIIIGGGFLLIMILGMLGPVYLNMTQMQLMGGR